MPHQLAWLIFLLPLFSFAVIIFIIRPLMRDKPEFAGYTIIGALSISLALSVWAFFAVLNAPHHEIMTPDVSWVVIEGLTIHLGLILDPLTIAMLFVVTVVSPEAMPMEVDPPGALQAGVVINSNQSQPAGEGLVERVQGDRSQGRWHYLDFGQGYGLTLLLGRQALPSPFGEGDVHAGDELVRPRRGRGQHLYLVAINRDLSHLEPGHIMGNVHLPQHLSSITHQMNEKGVVAIQLDHGLPV